MPSVPFEYECDKSSGFIMDPNQHKCVGYVTSLGGLGSAGALAADLLVSVPFNGASRPHFANFQYQSTGPATSAKVVGVMEKFEWEGAVGAPIKLEFYVSQENATLIKTAQQAVLSSSVKSLSWWIGDFDQETRQWYEKAYPLTHTGAVDGVIAGRDNPELDVDLNPEPVKDGIDVNVYKISLAVAQSAHQQYSLNFANSATHKVVKAWGLVIGSLAGSKFA